MRPPFAYYGGKVGMSHRIVQLLPPHRVYIEPFFGSGAVLFAKPPATHEIVNDLDHNVVTFFRVLRTQLAELERVCSLTPHARAEFDDARLDVELDDLERARRFWVRINQSFAKTHNDQTGWSITTARTQAVPASIASRIARFAAVADRLARVSIESCDAVDLIDRLATSPDTVVYADPPYLATTRRRVDQRRVACDYATEFDSPAQHERLAAALHRTPAKVVLSGYSSPLYDDLYRGWDRLEIPVAAHSSNAAATRRTSRLEVLWCNRPLDGRLALA